MDPTRASRAAVAPGRLFPSFRARSPIDARSDAARADGRSGAGRSLPPAATLAEPGAQER